jgi:hypothetical protein
MYSFTSRDERLAHAPSASGSGRGGGPGVASSSRTNAASSGVAHRLALPHALLADVVEHDAVAVVVHVALEQRADAERLVLLGVAVAADAEERLADEPHHAGAHAALR